MTDIQNVASPWQVMQGWMPGVSLHTRHWRLELGHEDLTQGIHFLHILPTDSIEKCQRHTAVPRIPSRQIEYRICRTMQELITVPSPNRLFGAS